MTIERQIRTMITHADPARGTTISPAVTTATQVIARADAAAAATGTHRPALVRRRLVLVGGAAMAAAAVTAYALPRRATTDRDATRLPDLSPTGQVIVPIGYEFDSDPQPAAPRLRALAAQIVDAPHDTRTGRYAYRHGKSWSSEALMSEAGFAVGFVEEEHMWTAPDGSGRNRRKTLGVQYANEESRRYWEGRPAAERQPFLPDQVDDIPVGGGTYGSPPGPDATRPPANRADLARMLNARYGAIDAAKWTMELYRSYVVPRSVRAQVLLILADLDGFVWRGAATDRAGRRGVAISALWTPGPDEGDQNRYEWGLLFDPRTGELLVLEVSILTPHRRPFEYDLILAPGWTDQLG